MPLRLDDGKNMRNIKRELIDAISSIIQSEAVVRERRRRIRESVRERSKWDHRLKGKSVEELDVIATMETVRDTRTIADFDDQRFYHMRAQTFAQYLILSKLEELVDLVHADQEGLNRANTTPTPSKR